MDTFDVVEEVTCDDYVEVSDETEDWEYQDWRHNASLAIHLSSLQSWPPSSTYLESLLSSDGLRSIAITLDSVDPTWEDEPHSRFHPDCPYERAHWLCRQLLAA